ncbi:DedA family protein [bacterium]|nr:DedA family protein [bacterium]
MFERLTQRLVAEARSPRAEASLALVAFVESSVFPLPAEVIFLPMCLARPERALRYALIAAVASVLGGIFGWMIGHFLFDMVAAPILTFWHSMEAFNRLKAATGTGMILTLLVTSGAAHLPPMKVVTILAGAIGFNLWLFILAAVVARGFKFMLLGWAMAKYGAAIADVMARRLALAAIVVIVALAALWLARTYL